MAFIELSAAAVGLAASFLLYQCVIVIQRLYFSPLSAFPGPRLAAATYLPEIYYDIFKGEGGQLPFAHRKWHEKYGPIVRINPNEIHVQDSSWYEELYKASRPVDKMPNMGPRFGLTDSTVATNDAAQYRFRRGTLASFFSKRNIANFGPRVQANCHRMMARLEKEYQGTDRILTLSHMFESLAADTVMFATFGYDLGCLDSPEFNSPTNRATEQLVEPTKIVALMPFDLNLISKLPDNVITTLIPQMKFVLAWWQDMDRAIIKAQAARANGKSEENSMISNLLHQELPPHETTLSRMSVEAKATVGAGVETVARTLSVAGFHILQQPAVRDRLVEELTAAIPDPSTMPDANELAQLPYLSACIDEALRLTYGVVEKRTRAYHGGPLVYGDWTIPAGTWISMSNYDVSHDEKIFPSSFSYIPERWLGDPRAPDGRALSRYNVSFGKGMRNCVGMHLAYLELYIAVATFFRSPLALQARLYETTKADVELARDCFVPRAFKGSKGVRVVFQNLVE